MSTRKTVMCLGESLTAGWPTASGYRRKLAQALTTSPPKADVLMTSPPKADILYEFVGPLEDEEGLRHAGFNGYPTAKIVELLPELTSYKPNILILMLGLNNLPSISAEQTAADVRDIATAFLRTGTKKVYASLLSDVRGLSFEVEQYNKAIAKALLMKGVRLFDMGRAPGAASLDNPLFVDECHCCQAGYDRMADVVLKEVFKTSADLPIEPAARLGGVSMFATANAALLKAYPSMTASVRQLMLAFGSENEFGQSGVWKVEGGPSNNWGEVRYERGAAPAYITVNGKQYGRYPTLPEGAIAFYERWSSDREAANAAASGDVWKTADATLRARFGSDEASYDHATAYAQKLFAQARLAASALAEPLAVHLTIPRRPFRNPISVGNTIAMVGVASIFAGTLALGGRKA